MPQRETTLRIAVVFGFGSATTTEVVEAGERIGAKITFLVDANDHWLVETVRGLFLDAITYTRPEELLDRARERRFDGITTFSEDLVARTAALARSLSLVYWPPETAKLLTDKAAQRAVLTSAGVPSPVAVPLSAEWPADRLRTRIGAPPWIVKPTHGAGSRAVVRVDDECSFQAAAAEAMASGEPFLVERFLLGDDSICPGFGDFVSVETFSVQGDHTASSVIGKFRMAPRFLEHGHILPALLAAPDAAKVTEVSRLALDALGVLSGCTQTEIKFTPDGPQVIEVNGRLGGGLSDIIRNGGHPDPVEQILRLAVNLPLADDNDSAASGTEVQFLYLVRRNDDESVARSTLAAVRRNWLGLTGADRVRLIQRSHLDDIRVSHLAEITGAVPDHVRLRQLIDEIEATPWA